MGKSSSWFLFAFLLILTPLMIYYPATSLEGAQEGLNLWFTVALPALFPFMVVVEIIVGLGIPRLLGILLEPLMQPLFRLPGPAGLVVVIGFTTGFPIGAILTARLIQEGALTRAEGERLVPFTNNASPLFMLGAVGAGLFGQPEIGALLAISHYAANLAVGLIYAHTGHQPAKRPVFWPATRQKFSREWRHFRQQSPPPGEVLGLAVFKGMRNLLTIGGYLMFFSVIFRLLSASGVLLPVIKTLACLLPLFGFGPELAPALTAGLLEMTIGCQQLALAPAPLVERLLACAFILAWSGLSIQAQVAAFLAGSGVRLGRYLLARVLQGFFAVAFLAVFLTLQPLNLPVSSVLAGKAFNLWPAWPGLSGTIYLVCGGLFLLPGLFRRNRG
ncbi:MAG: sporulation integral membrane protein YlbJ [Heliobacteriaceae bacterium]|nr:sporulation integral membrane protein YlbJ [Heliobacteriaceae bacterium]MDD4587003.1 sporulation integral membrane protein YlbJ [Heliobacteriaceae bacterium]